MSGIPKPTTEEVAAAADNAADSCLSFEVARRKVFRHLNWNYLLPLPERSTRSEGLIWAQLFGNCKDCHTRHVQISRKAYYMWHAYCPFECFHKDVVDTIRMQPDEIAAKLYPPVPLPSQVKVVDPETASKSSGGILSSQKLKKDLARVQRDGPKALEDLRKAHAKARGNPEAAANFPELD